MTHRNERSVSTSTVSKLRRAASASAVAVVDRLEPRSLFSVSVADAGGLAGMPTVEAKGLVVTPVKFQGRTFARAVINSYQLVTKAGA